MRCRHVDQVTAKEMASLTETVTAPGILAVLRQKNAPAASLLDRRDPPAVLVALDSVADPGNLGSIIRTCDWFGVDAVVLGRNTVDLYNPKVVRATMGGLFHLPVVTDVDLLSFISHAKSRDYTVYVTDPAGEAHFDRVDLPGDRSSSLAMRRGVSLTRCASLQISALRSGGMVRQNRSMSAWRAALCFPAFTG